jgi:hypothetical protein
MMKNIYLREISSEDGRWLKLAQVRVQWRALVLASGVKHTGFAFAVLDPTLKTMASGTFVLCLMMTSDKWL